MKNRHYQDMLRAVRLAAAVLAAVCISQPIGAFAQEQSLDATVVEEQQDIQIQPVVNIDVELEEQTEE